MKELKVIMKALKAFGLKIHPAFFILVPLVVVAIVKFVKSRKAKAESAPDEADPTETTRALAPRTPEALATLELRPDAFLKVWKNFLKEIPSSFRRSLSQFKPIVLLGGAGSGKSSLVEQHTDWRRQSEQFFLGHAQDPNLQIYLGSRVVIQELSPNLLNNNTKQARTALQKLWRKLFNHHAPSVVIVVSATRLPSMTPDALEQLAQRIRSKINIISWAIGEPPNVRVALTHTDAIEGYAEFAQFADQQGVPLYIKPKSTDAQSLEKAFQEYESYLPLVLEHRAADDYKKVIRFLRQAPTVFDPLSRFIDDIFCAESLSVQPQLESIYLTSKEFSSVVSNPFWVDPSQTVIDHSAPLRRHIMYASAIAATLSVTSLVLYGTQRRQWFEAQEALKSIALPHASTADVDFSAISTFTRAGETSALRGLRPEFLSNAQETIANEASRNVLMRHLLPGFVQALTSKEPQLKSLYYLAIIRSAATNDLGHFILNQLDHVSHATDLRPDIIRVYIENTALPYEGTVSTADMPIQYLTNGVRDLEHWKFVLTQVRDLTEEGRAIDRTQLETLRQLTSELLEEQKQSERFRLAKPIVELLEKSPFAPDLKDYLNFLPQIEMTSLPDSARKPFREALNIIASSQFLSADTLPQTLLELIQGLRLAVQYPSVRASEPQAWELDVLGETFVFRNIDWFALMKKSRSEELLKDFVQWHREFQASVFFKDPEAYLPIVLNPTNNGNSLFVGKTQIDGMYTRDAFEAEVRPTLLMLDEMLKELRLEPKIKTALELLVDRKLTEYAQTYVGQASVFYNDFELRAESSQSLLVILKQLLNPISPFTDFLKAIHRNTSIDFTAQEMKLFGPMVHALAPFQSFNAVMVVSADNTNEFEKYRTIIDQLYTTMTQVAAPSADAEQTTQLPGLQSALSPPAQQALETLSGNSGTYIEMVETWLDSVGLAQSLRRPFLQPVHQLHLVGLKELETVVTELWQFEVVPSFRPLLRQFPFDRTSSNEATPSTLTSLLHPTEGTFHQLKERYLAPLLTYHQGRYWPKASILRPLALPAEMLETTTRLEKLTQTLWDNAGTPKKLEFRISPVPFGTRSAVGNRSLTLAYVGLGKDSVVNINQKPFETKLELDWTSKEVSQIGARVTDTGNRLVFYPDPIITTDSYWSYFQLLEQGVQRKTIWSWDLELEGVPRPFEASFRLKSDPWQIFEIVPSNKPLAYEQSSTWTP